MDKQLIYKRIFWGLLLVLVFIMPVLSLDFGQNGDEDVEIVYGSDIYKYYSEGDMQATYYDPQKHPMTTNIEGMQYYGGGFNLLTEVIHKIFPSSHIVQVRHTTCAVFGVLLILFTGLLAYRLSNKNWLWALIASFFILLSPRIFGESMNNGKDIPFATGMVMGVYYLVRILQDLQTDKKLWLETMMLALSWMLIIWVRSAGGLLFVAYVGLFVILYFLFEKEKRKLLFANASQKKKLIIRLLVAFVLGYILGILTWPFAMQAPIGNFFATLQEFTNRSVGLRVLFDGHYYSNMAMPWYYHTKWILLTSPVIIIICFALFFLFIKSILKKFGAFTASILIFGAIFPIAYIVYSGATVHDTWRHVFFVYPFWVIMATFAIAIITQKIPEKLRWIPLIVVAICLIPVASWTVRSHPNQYIYFNEFAGGLEGAYGKYDLDYYHNSGKQLADWVRENAQKKADGSKLIVLSNMDGMDYYFRNDTSWIVSGYGRYYERGQLDWDYYITFGRFVSPWQLENGKWPPANAVHTLTIDEIPIGTVLYKKSKASVAAYKALNNKQFDTAVNLYAQYLKEDASDEMVWLNYAIALASTGRIDESIQAAQNAIKLSYDNAQLHQVLAQLYAAKGDQAAADKANYEAQMIIMRQQEYLPRN